MKIKMFTGVSYKNLEERINEFLNSNITNVVIESHKVATHGYEDRHYVMISYDDIT